MKTLMESCVSANNLIARHKIYLQVVDSRKRAIIGFPRYHQVLATYAYFEENDIQKARQEFYTVGRLCEYRIKVMGVPELLGPGTHYFGSMLIAGESNMIDRYCHYTGFNNQFVQIMQSAILDDRGELANLADQIRPLIPDKNHNIYPLAQSLVEYIDGVLTRDVIQVQKALDFMDSPKVWKKRSTAQGTVVAKYISHPTMGLAKAAWLIGLEVEVASEYVPKSLLVVEENEEYYDVYDFLREID